MCLKHATESTFLVLSEMLFHSFVADTIKVLPPSDYSLK